MSITCNKSLERNVVLSIKVITVILNILPKVMINVCSYIILASNVTIRDQIVSALMPCFSI